MDFIGLLTGSENLYKYLFVGGLALILTSLFYPLSREYELAIQKDSYNKDIKLVNLDIEDLKVDVNSLKSKITYYDSTIKNAPSDTIKRILKDSVNKKLNLIKLKQKSIAIKNIDSEYAGDKIKTLTGSINDMRGYVCAFIISGSLFTIVGLLGWFLLMLKQHKKEDIPPPASNP